MWWRRPRNALSCRRENVEPTTLFAGSEGYADHPLAAVASDLHLSAAGEDQKRIAERLSRPTPARSDPVASRIKPPQRGANIIIGDRIDILPH
jgi:hypothetical protein